MIDPEEVGNAGVWVENAGQIFCNIVRPFVDRAGISDFDRGLPGLAKEASNETNETSADSTPDNEPTQVSADHLLDDFFDHSWREFFKPFFDDRTDAVKELGVNVLSSG